ncbi:MAG: cytochrome P460 family protein [Candidatus Thiodiazotropha sp. (ex Epidulcina cf. delphinae)]|nr:cytochrome P460 family protein [Candidatus Thiodiazotropha sp. (ex Epidulcina cf. delphinae)]
MRIVYFFRYFLSVLGLAVAMVLPVHAADSFSPNVDSEGNISLPDDFWRNMVHLGSWFVPEGGASGFHDVYTEVETVDAYRRTGQFPDGARLVKDTKDRFGNNPVWGDGWGWALFKTDQPKRNVATDYKSDCLGCHTPVKVRDWVYVEGYPTLNKP